MVITIILLSIAVVILLLRCYFYDLMCEVLTSFIEEYRRTITSKEKEELSTEIVQRFREYLKRRFKRR